MFNSSKKDNTSLPAPARGQGFSHELSMRRDWEEALDALHFMLLRKWYYVGIATNTKRGIFNKVLKQGIAFERKRTQIPEEMKSVLNISMGQFDKLKEKIEQKRRTKRGEDKDVWHFTTQWKEFPEGTKIVELYQKMASSMLKAKPTYKRGFIVLDGKCNTSDQNTVMLLMKKIFENKDYTKKILYEVEKMKKEKGQTDEPEIVKKDTLPKGDSRTPGTLLIELKENPGSITSVTDYEKGLLLDYFQKLRRQEAFTQEHEVIETRLKQLFGEI